MFSARSDGSLFVRKYYGDRSAFGIRAVEMPNVLEDRLHVLLMRIATLRYVVATNLLCSFAVFIWFVQVRLGERFIRLAEDKITRARNFGDSSESGSLSGSGRVH
jgi:hypothetical protein